MEQVCRSSRRGGTPLATSLLAGFRCCSLCVEGFIVNSQDALPSASFLMQGASQRAVKGKVRVDEMRFRKRANSSTGDEVGV